MRSTRGICSVPASFEPFGAYIPNMGRRILAGAVAITLAVALTGTAAGTATAAKKPGQECMYVEQMALTAKHILVCRKKGDKKVWVKLDGPTQTPDSTKAEPETSSDPVTEKIQRRLGDLPMPNLNATVPPMGYITENPADEEWIPRLNIQISRLAQAYPEFTWSQQGITIMPRTPEWLTETMRQLGCNDEIIARTVSGFNDGSPIWGKGATDCNSSLGTLAVIANNLPVGVEPGELWDYMVAAEFTEAIRENRFAMSPQPMNGPVPMRYYNVGMPSWMREGVEPAFHSIAKAMQTREWAFEHIEPRVTCGTEILSDYAGFTTSVDGCHYVLGYAANELMIALYGWDAPLLWWSSFGTQQDPYVAFTNAYGDDYATFERYVRELVRYRAYGEPLSDDLQARLA